MAWRSGAVSKDRTRSPMRDEQDLRRQMRAQQNTAPSRSVPRQRSPSIGAGGGGGGGGGGTGKAKAKARARGESRDLEDLL